MKNLGIHTDLSRKEVFESVSDVVRFLRGYALDEMQKGHFQFPMSLHSLVFACSAAVLNNVGISKPAVEELRAAYKRISEFFETPDFAVYYRDANTREMVREDLGKLASMICIFDMANDEELQNIVAGAAE